jgi:hypothetical protein
LGSSERTAIEASYSVFSAKYGTDSTSFREWRQKHCESGQSKEFRSSESTEYSRTVYDNSVEAWVKCLELENSNILVQPAFDPTGKFINFNVKYIDAGSVKLTGVSIQPHGSFECKDAKKMSVGSDTEVQLSPKAWALECTRVVKEATDTSGGKYESAPAAMLTIRTEEKLFPMQFIELRSPDLATRNAAELMQTIQSLKNELSALQRQISSQVRSISQDIQTQGQKIHSVDEQVFAKGGNNGTVSCNVFCAGANWPGGTGTCVGAHMRKGPKAGQYIACSEIPDQIMGVSGGQIHTLCWCSKFQ